MKKKILVTGAAMVFSIMLTGCHMRHEWQEASCTKPQTCAVCGEEQGEALGHNWQEADCTHPQTCATCGETKGEALGHNWQEDCIHPPTCSVCGETNGEAKGHIWQEADCLTPQTCAVCGETNGEALGHSWQEADYFTPETCTACGETQGEPLQPSFEAHGLAINAQLGETYDYVTCCAADKSLNTVGKLTFSNYRIFEDTLTEGYEWRAVHIKIEFSDENAMKYGVGVYYSNENYYDTEAWDEVYDRGDNSKLYTIRFKGKDYTECKSIFSGPGFGEWVDGVQTWEGDAFAVVPAGYDGIVVCLRNARLEGKIGDYIYDVADEDTIFFRLGDEGAAKLPPVGEEDTVSEEEETGNDDAVDAMVQKLVEKITDEFPQEIADRLLAPSSSVLIRPHAGKIALIIEVAKPEYIPEVVAPLHDFIQESVGESYYALGSIYITFTGRKPDGSRDIRIKDTSDTVFMSTDWDADSMVWWFSKDGVRGDFSSVPEDITIEDCTAMPMYEHYADKLGLMDREQTVETIIEQISRSSRALFYEDEAALSVSVEDDSIVVLARTYKDYLVPVLAANVTEAIWNVKKESFLPFGKLRVYCADDSEDGGIDEGTEVFWETADLEAGVFKSAPDGVYKELYTIEDVYEYYEEYFDLMDRALNGEQIDDED